MLSRRTFLAGGLAVSAQSMFWHPALAKHKSAAAAKQGPHVVARQDWAPAIAPAQIGVTDRGICCFTDEYGRLALIDFKHVTATKPLRVLGQLGGLGKKVIQLKVIGSRAYIAVLTENQAQPQLELIIVSMDKPEQPAIASRLVLDKFSEITSLTADGAVLCVGGTTGSGDQLVAIYSNPKPGHPSEPAFLSAFAAEAPVVALDLQNRTLVILETKETSQLQVVNLLDPRTPILKKTVPLEGEFTSLSRMGDIVVVAGSFEIAGKQSKSGVNIGVKSVALTPVPHVVSQIPLDPLTTVLDTAASRGQFLILGDADQETLLISMSYDKMGVLSRTRELENTKLKPRMGQSCRIAAQDRNAYVATGWSGVQVLTMGNLGWSATTNYTIPKYAASSIAFWQNLVVLGGSDLKLYDIAQPDKPLLVSTTDFVGNTKTIVGAGSYILCLYKDQLTLRKMQKLDEVVATLKITGSEVSFDAIKQKVYVLQNSSDKKTVVTKVQAYSNSLVSEQKFEFDKAYLQAVASDDFLVVSNLNDVALYKVSAEAELIGTRHFENLAVRDIAVTKDNVLVTAIDQASKGFLLVLSKDQNDLKVLASLSLPNDGRAIAVAKGTAVIIGQADGRDSAVVISLKNAGAPSIVSSMNIIEEAAAVVIKDETAIVGGRGLEILSLA
ncbi:MAG: hypothetical protein P4L53_12830 [Candidatus Obscuribacterales bacterium]|nr:hypothetical protein [Candidatus Obscuribacterales bacterium]